MEQTSCIAQWKPEPLLKALSENKLQQKAMKIKLDRLYMISTYNEQQYLPDVFDSYCWIKLANEDDLELKDFIANQKSQKYFIEQFVSHAIKDMILCKRFKHKIMMVLTQQIMVEALRLFIKYLPHIEKFPKMTSILRNIFDFEKQFYRINYPNQYLHMVIPPSQQRIDATDHFVQELKPGDKVDALKTQIHSKRVCWLPGTVKKITSINIYVLLENQKSTSTFEKRALQVAPPGEMRRFYDWRFQLKVGDLVDFQDSHNHWRSCKIIDIKGQELQQDPSRTIKQVELEVVSSNNQMAERQIEIVSLTDPRIQKAGNIIFSQKAVTDNNYSQMCLDDYNDLIFDFDMTYFALSRPETVKSQLFVDLLVIAQSKFNLFQQILQIVRERRFGIEVTAELITIVYIVQPLFHRKFALEYLSNITQAIIGYISKMNEQTIRNFSKERYENIFTSISEFLKRIKSPQERKQITQDFQLNLILRFLFSDFLDRKLLAISMITTFYKTTRHSMSLKTTKQFDRWINENKILPVIYNEKSHSQLINRSTEFMQIYLLSKPSMESLTPLLEWNDPIIKLVSELFDYFPEQFQAKVVAKIKERDHVTNPDALNIIKKTVGCQSWLLKNGGESWVQVVKDKQKRKADIAEVFDQQFSIVMKITKQISQLYDCRIKNEYFMYANQINYLSKVLSWDNLDIKIKLDYAMLVIEPLQRINDEIFISILPLTTDVNDSLPQDYQKFFVDLLPKLTKKHLQQLFDRNFKSTDNLVKIGEGQFNLFKRTFISLNQQVKNIERKFLYKTSPNSFRRQKKSVDEVTVNPNDLIGMDQLLLIIFQNKNLSVAQRSLKLIGYLFDNLTEKLASSAVQFRQNFLNTCLQKFYSTNDQQEKFLKILEKLMNESQKEGLDEEPSVAALFPLQTISYKIIDHFNVTKKKLIITVPSNLTLYQFRGQIGKVINAYIHQIRIITEGKEVDARLNGHIIHNLKFEDDLIIEKKVEVEKMSLSTTDGKLAEKAKIIFINFFREHSTLGMMSKQQCIKYHQRCVGEVSSVSQSRVEKIYETYDTDKDGYLTQQDFLNFYQTAVKGKQSAVWNNLETLGVRNDLQILSDMEIKFADAVSLTRTLLFKDKRFMQKLFDLMESESQSIAAAAWNLANRLPLAKNIDRKFNLEKKYALKYWLYLVEYRQQADKVQNELLKQILEADVQTICIGLKVCGERSDFQKGIFKMLMKNLGRINKGEHFVQHKTQSQKKQVKKPIKNIKNMANNIFSLNFYDKVVLDYSLKIVKECLKSNKQLMNEYLQNIEEYDSVFSSGLMSVNPAIRTMYCQAISLIMEETTEENWPLFEALFNLVYRNFNSSDKSTFHIEYFDLFSKLLEMLRQNTKVLERLKLNWKMLTNSMIKQYKQHKCREESLNSPPDEVAQGFLRIISRLIDTEYLEDLTGLVSFIFKSSLFPESGLNKLKNSKSRKDAYELIYEICKLKDKQGQSPGLKVLFDSGFKEVYKKMSQTKSASSYNFSYYYSYNQARSELGYAGIRNLGCICYMISMLQQLYMTPSFRYLTLMADDGEPECLAKKGTKQIDDNIFHQLQALFANLQLTERQEYNPEELCFSFKDFQGNPVNVSIQQDAQQFLNIFFDKIENAIKGTPFKHILENIFGGKSCSRTVCSNCKAIKERQQNFYPLSLQMKGYKSIYDSLKQYIHGEVISDYQCDFCNKKTDVTKSSYIAKPPDHFIFHIQRMCFNYDRFENQKVNSRWQFPHQLNIYDYSLAKQNNIEAKPGEYQYRLKGIVIHYGSADFGHYFSYIKENSEDTNKWIEFNDQRIREFDPRDIELQCFGGEHWRREHQNAYLLVYERIQQSDIKLEFDSVEQKQEIMKKFKFSQKIIEQPKRQIQDASPQRDKQSEIERERQKSQQISETASDLSKQNESQPKQPEKKKIITYIDPLKITPYVPQKLAAKINKANEEFSFSINLSNDEFAHFIYRILSVDPPSELITEYLQLSYECFSLKQIVDESQSVTLSEWAAKRFRDIISGHGWNFLKNFGQNWQNDIIAIQRSTRVGMKNVLECVITDIIKDIEASQQKLKNQAQIQQSEMESQILILKKKTVFDFLEKYTQMMHEEVAKHSTRLQEYFEVWSYLVSKNELVVSYCQEKRLCQNVLDFVMEDESIIPRKGKKKHMMSSYHYHNPDFGYPLEFLSLMISKGYKLSELERKCMKSYAFMNKIISFPTKQVNLIEMVCKDSPSVSERFAYLLLHSCSKVTHSDSVKPIISAIYQFISMQDESVPIQQRVEWIIGFPQFIQQNKTNSYGMYGISPDNDYVVNFISAIGNQPILKQLIRFKSKAHHVAVLLLTMLLQLQKDGFIHNLDEFPAAHAFQYSYTFWFKHFVQWYYADTHQPFIGSQYIEYSNRMKRLFDERPNRKSNQNSLTALYHSNLPEGHEQPDQYFGITGKTFEKHQISANIINESIEVVQFNIQSGYTRVPTNLSALKMKTMKKLQQKSEKVTDFMPKPIVAYGLSKFNRHASQSSDDQQLKSLNQREMKTQAQLQKEKIQALTKQSYLKCFENSTPNWIFRKVLLKNLSSDSILCVVTIIPGQNCNLLLPASPLSIEIRQGGQSSLSLVKKDFSKDYGQIKIDLKILGRPCRPGYYPIEIITEADKKQQSNTNSPDGKGTENVRGSDDEDDDDYGI